MTYKPTDEDFEGIDGYKISAEDFEDEQEEPLSSEIPPMPHSDGFLSRMAKALSSHPRLARLTESAANSPIAEAALSARPALLNSLANIANIGEIVTGKKVIPEVKRDYPEPLGLKGRAGSMLGDVLGKGVAFAAIPGSTTVPGALATGFAEGEGNAVSRTADALLGLLIPGLVHSGKFAKTYLSGKKVAKNIRNMELEQGAAQAGVHNAKEDLATRLNTDLESVKKTRDNDMASLENLTSNSESFAKQAVANSAKAAKDANIQKYKQLYEGFNESPAGQSAVKDPITLESLEQDYGFNPNNFSKETKALIKSHIGDVKHTPASEEVSVITGKPIKEAATEVSRGTPKVADYINLWKQLRAEVAQYRQSARLAETPEAAQNLRSKAKDLEKLSDDVHSKAMESLSKTDAAKYAAIQRGYMHEVVPFNEESLLVNATDKFPKIPNNFFDKLNNLGSPELIQSLKASHPKLVEAITNHDIKGLEKLNASDLKELISGDFARFIPDKVKKTLSSLQQVKAKEELLRKALGSVQSSEIGRIVKSSDINDILRQRPDLAKPFANVKQEQERLRKLKKALLDEGFKQKAIQESLQKYKSALSLAKTAAVPVGAYFGIKKAKNSGSF